ncbi:MAG: DUF4111 domain-containing protein [Actinobacteria bacterium]|nr:DUF4111 domain-containing protein [Actinomycetota bacterium]MBO0834766.1 DUF4111 domain-containing protein [Actinomycetota bacterium]
MNSGAEPPGNVLAYARTVTHQLIAVSGDLVQAAYLHGSAVLGGWIQRRSDVDMMFVAADRIGGSDVERISRALRTAALPCPGREMECSVVTVAQAAQPTPPWRFVLHVAVGFGPDRVVRPSSQSPGDPDLLMHYAVCRAAGWPVYGPPAAELIGAIPRPVILGYLADELGWGIEHAPEAYAVLNACRAHIYATDQKIVSKLAGGEAAVRRGTGPAEVIERALAQQRGIEPLQRPTPDAVSFIRTVIATLRSLAGGSVN